MKSERRHELQHNELADQLNKIGAALKPYANILLGGALLIVIIAIGWALMSRSSAANTARSWDDYNLALGNQSFAELENVVEHYAGTQAADWAQVCDADLRLTEGCSELYTSKAGANEDLNKAIDQYEAVLAKSVPPLIRQKATFGMARALEAQGSVDKAIGYYKKLVDTKGLYAEIAQARVDDLSKKSTKAFYDDFAKFDPKPAYRDDAQGPLQFDNLDNITMPSPGDSLLPNLDPMSGNNTSTMGSDLNTPSQPTTETPAETPTDDKGATTEGPKQPETTTGTPTDDKGVTPEGSKQPETTTGTGSDKTPKE